MGWSSSALTRSLVLLLAAQVLAAAVESPAAAYLAKNNDKFKRMLSAVSVDDTALNAMHGVLLVPSNAAVEALASSMGMTTQQLLANKLLVDQITAYHFLPNLGIKKGAKLPTSPIITNTAEVHYVVRYMKDPHTKKAWLVDMQGNKVHLKQQPVILGNLTVVPIDKVLMSGGYYKSVEDALKLHAQLARSSEVAQKAGGLASTAAAAAAAGGSRTLFVPVDRAFDASKVSVSAMSAADSRRVLQYHTLPTAVPAGQLGSGSRATLLSGHEVKVETHTSGELQAPWTGKAVSKPAITVTDESGNKADVTLHNIWAGKDVIHGISRVLTPTAAATSTEKAHAQQATTTTTSSTSTSPSPSSTAAAAAAAAARKALVSSTETSSNWRLLGSHAFHRLVGQGRRLLQSQFGPDWSQQRNPASALLAQNTVGAAYSAANSKNTLRTAYYATPDVPGWSPLDYWSDWETNA